MRKVITALLTCTALCLSLATAGTASAQVIPRPQVLQAQVWVCDGNGAGSCMSLKSGATEAPGEKLISLGINAGAWTWLWGIEANVGQGKFTFSYGPLENQLQGDPVYVFQLFADSIYCAANSGGSAVINPCTGALAQAWVFDPANGYLVNMGRSNDQNNWEVLCNPGTGMDLYIGTRDSCTTYHKEWSFASG